MKLRLLMSSAALGKATACAVHLASFTKAGQRRRLLIGNVIESRDRDLEGHHPIVAPWIRRTSALMTYRSGGRTRAYAGMRTFISVMPWIRFE
jgi:hypothetical protein